MNRFFIIDGFYNFPKKFIEKAEVIKVKPLDIQSITEEITIKVKKKNLICFFVSTHSIEDFKKNKTYLIRIELLTYNIKKISDKKKIIIQEDNTKEGSPTTLYGKIVDIVNTKESKIELNKQNGVWKKGERLEVFNKKDLMAIVDCGVFVAVEINLKGKFKIGDYVNAEGRLDIHSV